jgi:SsrA-binding protein
MSEALKEIAVNRKARFEYEILETFEAGIILTGTEIKSIREGSCSLDEAYISVKDAPFLINASIAPYKYGNVHNHEEKRPRKLLMHHREIAKLHKALSLQGLTLIPLSMYFKNGFAKVKIGLCRGKKLYDKRESIKKREQTRAIEQIKKYQ